jgi:hypothetical protein
MDAGVSQGFAELATQVEAALAGHRAALEADGYELRVSLADERVVLSVTATPQGCADCLVPAALFKNIVMDEIFAAGLKLSPEGVEIRYPETYRQITPRQ